MTLNGRPGLVVSGGMSGSGERNLTSVEFYDVTTGQWVSLPGLVEGRRGHSMMVESGRMVVVGGMAGDNTYLKTMEVFNGERWVMADRKLRTGRQGFSVVKVPAKKLFRKIKRIPRRRS